MLLVEDDSALRDAGGPRPARGRASRDDGGRRHRRPAAAGPGPDTRFAAVVLDIGLPDSDGRDVCQALRSRGIDVPVLFLTARDQLHDVLAGFAAGGDDHMAKPFHVSELLARLRAPVRRGRPRRPRGPHRPAPRPAEHALSGPAGRQPLTPTEFRLLAALMASPGAVIRRRDLVLAGWPDGATSRTTPSTSTWPGSVGR